MNKNQQKQLCENLLNAENEEEVINLLEKNGYWGRPELWRYYGDVENNWGQSGNQQSLAEAALAEKIVNSVDARLINACWMNRIDPKSSAAPPSIRDAVADFFDDGKGGKVATGDVIREWGKQRIRSEADQITLCATGVRPKILNVTIADKGEGQTAKRLPETILSLSKSNKMYIPFVQGQFNQGGTGALRFCGKHNLQLVISRRNPALLEEKDNVDTDREWCFTVVRRERPEHGRKNSIYTYLAPIGVGETADPRSGSVLSFPADSFGIFPDEHGPYDRHAEYGTAIKMYEYNFIGERSNILRGKSLLSRLELLLPEVALPVRFYEYRTNMKGEFFKIGSRSTTALGLLRRIDDSENVEEGFPVSVPIQAEGEKLVAHVYAFVPSGSQKDLNNSDQSGKRKKLGGARSYRKSEGVLFLRNGQTQGSWSKDFYRRKAVKMKPLADDLMVFVECDELSDFIREDLFMPSRDRLAENAFKQSLIEVLEDTIRECPELKSLRNKRQRERLQSRLEDERPLTDVLNSLIQSSPNLVALLQLGQRISAPFSSQPTSTEPNAEFIGEVYPTIFKFKGVDYGTTVKLHRPINRRVRLTFETDARNDYFIRAAERGSFDLTWSDSNGIESPTTITGPTLKNGKAIVMMEFPEQVEVGKELTFITRVQDSMRSFEIPIVIEPLSIDLRKSDQSGDQQDPPGDRRGNERERAMEMAPPSIKRVYADDWGDLGFDEFTAMKIESLGPAEYDDHTELYQFQINMDNAPLKNESKLKRMSSEQHHLLCEQFLYTNVLIGLALLLEDKKSTNNESPDSEVPTEKIEDRVESVCRAIAPFVPAILSLGSGDLESDSHLEGLEEVG